MLQNIENFYLAILRIVVIGVAGVLLAAVVYFGLNSFGVVSPAPEETPVVPSVSMDAYKKELMGPAPTTSEQATTGPTQNDRSNEYAQIAKVLDTYYDKLYEGQITFDVGAIAKWVAEYGEKYPTEELKNAFATGLLARVNDLVADEGFRDWCLSMEWADSLQAILDTYGAEFDRQAEEAEAANEKRQAEHVAEKAESLQQLYIAGVAFLAFLLIVFLSIIIRIERNLRPQAQP